MKKRYASVLAVFISASVLALASWIPGAFFSSGQLVLETHKPRQYSLEGIERSVHLAKALSSQNEFSFENEGGLEDEEKARIFEKLISLVGTGGLPGFLAKEIQDVYGSVLAERLKITSDTGATISVIHSYYEWTGDWSNWMEIYIDSETEKILYLYLSGSCIEAGTEYASAYLEVPTLDEISFTYGDYMGYTVLGLENWQNQKQNAVMITYGEDGASAKYLINFIYYPGTMYDIKIAPQLA